MIFKTVSFFAAIDKTLIPEKASWNIRFAANQRISGFKIQGQPPFMPCRAPSQADLQNLPGKLQKLVEVRPWTFGRQRREV